MNKTIFLVGILFGILAVLLGAFGAHGLENLVDADAIQTWETGVTYQMYHALLLLVLANVNVIPESHKKWIFYCILAGIILFSFSIYFLATNTLTSFDFKTIGFVTPIGGLFLILAWALLGFRYWKCFK
ncbi:Uncharacterized membrane protein YgdD, TMEM256/DUF423 family [Pricia antarctica]|uniref:Uncharacterized membrane protein YgdD, TMEM256/DUF423 family n=1 Tax=Pricia antarctica TaxID=641691 RepID=A0A1G6Y324_9FLAO|nr:DUF423 domain-containing protein [Pricia antarctica]SDD84894.1 Uncharacterized membrane protein YgdD, TMEM256/DUF423 family [Pricia antarctica]